MTAIEARAELLAQHRHVRTRLAALAALGERLRAGADVRVEFCWAAVALGIALDKHNTDEQTLLEPILARGDDWAPARLARMREEHTAEHAALHAALHQEPIQLALVLSDFAEELRAHMEAEERTFLHPAVLRD